jgi:hypothetical protein
MMRIWLLLAVGALALPPAWAAAAGKGAGPRLGSITTLEITVVNRADVERLVLGGYDVEAVSADRVVVYADGEEYASLRAEGWAMRDITPGVAKDVGAYHSYAELTAALDGYVTKYPALCRKVSLGKSVQNRDLWALKITSNPDAEGDKPEFKYVSTIHGNETLGIEMCVDLIDLLVKGYGSNNTRIVNLVNNVEIWVLPLMNPDGRESSPPQRYNANGYDLNRSFPEGSGTNFGNRLYGPPMNTNGLPVEVRRMMAWVAAHNFVLGANFHTGSLVANYSYDNDGLGSVYSPSPDEALLAAMARTYASNNAPMWSNNAAPFVNGVVNGAAWYSVVGGMQDWNYRYDGCFDLTIELSHDFEPAAGQLPTLWSQNSESMLAYLEWVLRGVRGVLRDAQTGQPVKGAVRVAGCHHLVFSDPEVGDYHRLLLPGTYTLWFYAPGYVPQRISNVAVGSGAATRVDVALEPASARFAAKVNFQPASAPVPAGFVADAGAAFGARGNGYSYGWETTLSSGYVRERKAGRSQDLRYDTLVQMQAGGAHTWEMAVPNGPYSVLVAAGDPSYSTGTYRIQAEGVPVVEGSPSAADRWVEGLATVLVTDGRLSLTSAAGAASNRLAFVEISALEPATVAQWRAVYFGTTNNTGSGADSADPDGDGIPNLLEYAFGLDPGHADAGAGRLSAVVVRTNGADWFGCSFLRNTNATDLTLKVQGLGRLAGAAWTDVATYTAGSGWTGSGPARETAAASNRVSATILDAQPIGANTNRFLRLRVANP